MLNLFVGFLKIARFVDQKRRGQAVNHDLRGK